MDDEIKSAVILHTACGDSTPDVHIFGGGDVRVFWVDDNAPNDRVFEMTFRTPVRVFRELIPEGTEIGSSQDERHEAIANKVNALMDGRKPFHIVKDGGNVK